MFINKAVKKNKYLKFIFVTVTVLIAVGLVIPIAGLFKNQPGNSGQQPSTGQNVPTLQEQLAGLEAKAQEKPQDTAVLMELGEAYHYAGKPDQAIKTFEQVLALEPNNIAARYNMAMIYYYSAKYDASIAQLEEIIQYDPGNKEAHQLYGYVLGAGKKDYAAGIRELEKFIDLGKQGLDVEKARQAIEEWKALAPQE